MLSKSVLVILSLYATCCFASDVLELGDDDFASRVAETETTLAMFYAPWFVHIHFFPIRISIIFRFESHCQYELATKNCGWLEWNVDRAQCTVHTISALYIDTQYIFRCCPVDTSNLSICLLEMLIYPLFTLVFHYFLVNVLQVRPL